MNTSESPLLYSFRRCPYAIRSRLALYYASIKVQIIEVDLKDKPLAMLQASPKGTVPVMRLANGRVIDESWDIMCWAMAQNNHQGLLDKGLQEQTRQLVDENDYIFKPKLDRYKYADRYPEFSAEYYLKNCLSFLDQLEVLLRDNQFLLSNQEGLVDLAIFPFIRQFAFVDKGWFDQAAYPKLQNWLQHWLASEQFAAVMKKRVSL